MKTTQGPRTHSYEVNAILTVSKASEGLIRKFFLDNYDLRPNRLSTDLHLTIYHGRRPLPASGQECRSIEVSVDMAETRFMVLAPGGENPRPDLAPRELSVGVRLTRRNRAVDAIQRLRESVYRFETPEIIGNRNPTTARTNCFGSRNYQPHIQLLKPWHKIDSSLSEIGERLRSEVQCIEFDRFKIEFRRRVEGGWVVARG